MIPPPVSLAGLVLRVLLWLPLCYALWYPAAPVLLLPAVLMSQGALHALLPGIVDHMQIGADGLRIFTTLSSAPGGHYGFTLDARSYGYGMALLAALVLATPAPRRWADLLLGLGLLQPFIAWGLVFAVLRALLAGHAEQLLPDPGARRLWTEGVQLGARLGLLAFAPLAPVLIWAGLQHRTLSRILSGGSPAT